MRAFERVEERLELSVSAADFTFGLLAEERLGREEVEPVADDLRVRRDLDELDWAVGDDLLLVPRPLLVEERVCLAAGLLRLFEVGVDLGVDLPAEDVFPEAARLADFGFASEELALRAAFFVDFAADLVPLFDDVDFAAFRFSRRCTFRRASINSSFRIPCHPVISCWRAKSAKSRRVWFFRSAVVITFVLLLRCLKAANRDTTVRECGSHQL